MKKEVRNGRKRSRKRRRRACIQSLMLLLMTAAASIYLLISLKYNNTFLPHTTIDGISVSGMTIDEVKAEISDNVSRYELVLEERDGKEERIYGRDIELSAVFDTSLEAILKGQNPVLWGIPGMIREESLKERIVTFNEEKLKVIVESLVCMDPAYQVEPVNARLSYVSGTGLQILPEDPGNIPEADRLLKETEKAVQRLQERINLEEVGIYKKPDILSSDDRLLARQQAWKPYTDVTVTYRFGSRSEVLDGSVIFNWLSYDDEGVTSIDQEMVEDYVKGLAKKYNTAYCAKELKTSYGPTVTITKGNYGWLIDKQAEITALTEIIESGISQEREPVYAQKAASFDGPDYGDTYVEMNLTAQHLYFYKNGKLLIESDFVSGNEAKGWSTPAGAYELTYKQKNAVLRGKNYNTPVTYWMPFNGNIGMHDGYWRSDFGGTIYKKNGSHGCVNLPPAVAKTIYENIEAGVPVLCYHLEGTENRKTTSASTGKTASSSAVSQTEAVGSETVGSETVSSETVSSETVGSETVGSEAVASETVGSETVSSETISSEAAVTETTSHQDEIPENTQPASVPEHVETVVPPGP